MQKVYWVTNHFTDDEYKDNPYYNKYTVMGLAPRESGLCFCVTDDGKGYAYHGFDTYEECVTFITEINKPTYWDIFRTTNYELINVPRESEKWYECLDMWYATMDVCKQIKELKYMSWHRRLAVRLPEKVKDSIIRVLSFPKYIYNLIIS